MINGNDRYYLIVDENNGQCVEECPYNYKILNGY